MRVISAPDLPSPYMRSPEKTVILPSPALNISAFSNTPVHPSIPACFHAPTPARYTYAVGPSHARFLHRYYNLHGMKIPAATDPVNDPAKWSLTVSTAPVPPPQATRLLMLSRDPSGLTIPVEPVMPQTLIYNFATGIPAPTTPHAYTREFVFAMNVGLTQAFALYVATPYELAFTSLARQGGSYLKNPLLHFAALLEHNGRPFRRDLLPPHVAALYEQAGYDIGARNMDAMGDHPLGHLYRDTPPTAITREADELSFLPAPLSIRFSNLRDAIGEPNLAERSGMWYNSDAGDKSVSQRTEPQIWHALHPTQAMMKHHPRPLWLSNDVLLALIEPFHTMLPFRSQLVNKTPLTEYAPGGAVFAAIKASLKDQPDFELRVAEAVWQFYYRLLLNYFYHFGGDYTVIDGHDGYTAERAAQKRSLSPYQRATCVHHLTLDNLLTSLRYATYALVSLGSKKIPMEPMFRKGMKFAHPFALHGEKNFDPTIPFGAWAHAVQGDPLPKARGETLYTCDRMAADRLKVKTLYRKKLVSFRPEATSVFIGQRLMALRSVRVTNSDYKGEAVFDPALKLPGVNGMVARQSAAYLLKATSNVGSNGVTYAVGEPFNYAAEEISALAHDVLNPYIGADPAELPVAIARMDVEDRGDIVYTRGGDFLFGEGWEKRYPTAKFERVPTEGVYGGMAADKMFYVPTPSPIHALTEAPVFNDVVGLAKIRALTLMRVYSWAEYLNDAIHTYNIALDRGLITTSSAASLKGREPRRRRLLVTPLAVREHDYDFGPLDVEKLLHDAAKPLATIEQLKTEFALASDEVFARREAFETAEAEQRSTHYTKRALAKAKHDVMVAAAKLVMAQEGDNTLTGKQDISRALSLPIGLLLLNGPTAFMRNGEALSDIDSKIADGLDRPKPAMCLEITQEDKPRVIQQKNNMLEALGKSLSHLPKEVKDEADDPVRDYVPIETAALMGAANVCLERTYQELEKEHWAQPIRDAVTLDPYCDVLNTHGMCGYDSYQFSLMRAAYMSLLSFDRLVFKTLRHQLRTMFVDKVIETIALLETEAATMDATASRAFRRTFAPLKSLSSVQQFEAAEKNLDGTFETFKQYHKASWEELLNDFDHAWNNTAEGRNALREGQRLADLGIPYARYLDRIDNRATWEAYRTEYNAHFDDIATAVDALLVPMRMVEQHHPEFWAKWKTLWNTSAPSKPLYEIFPGTMADLINAPVIDEFGNALAQHTLVTVFALLDPLFDATGSQPFDFETFVDAVDQLDNDQSGNKGGRFGAVFAVMRNTCTLLASDLDPSILGGERPLIGTNYGTNLIVTEKNGMKYARLISNWRTRTEARKVVEKPHSRRGPESMETRVRTGKLLHPREFVRCVIPRDKLRTAVAFELSKLGPNILATDGWPDDDQVGNDPLRVKLTPAQIRTLRRSVLASLFEPLNKLGVEADWKPAPNYKAIPALQTKNGFVSHVAQAWWWQAAVEALRVYYEERGTLIDTLESATVAFNVPIDSVTNRLQGS